MRDKKKDEDEKTTRRQTLEKHVDAMMDPKLPDPENLDILRDPGLPEAEVETPPPAHEEPAPEPEPTVVSEPAPAVKTAPALPAKPRKRITVNHDDADDEREAEVTIGSAAEEPVKKKTVKAAKTKKLEKTGESVDDDQTSETPAGPAAADDLPPADIDEPSIELDDAQTDKAVDDIVAHEGDVMLAVADATAAEHNRQVTEATDPKGHTGVFATFLWFLVFVTAVIAVLFFVLLVTGGNLPGLSV